MNIVIIHEVVGEKSTLRRNNPEKNKKQTNANILLFGSSTLTHRPFF